MDTAQPPQPPPEAFVHGRRLVQAGCRPHQVSGSRTPAVMPSHAKKHDAGALLPLAQGSVPVLGGAEGPVCDGELPLQHRHHGGRLQCRAVHLGHCYSTGRGRSAASRRS